MLTLKPKDGEPFRVYNMHTDHVGKVARVLASNQMLQKLDENNLLSSMPAIVTGDFNAEPDDLCITTVTNYRGGEARRHLRGCRRDLPRLRALRADKDDYIFADRSVKCISCEAVRDRREDGLWLSDHIRVMATVEF